MKIPVSYIIADDHQIFRQGLAAALGAEESIRCIGEAEDGEQLLEMLRTSRPDVVLLDIRMPNMDGIEVLKRIRDTDQDIKVIPLTMYDDENYVLKLLKLGANGYLVKHADPDEIKQAILTVHETGHYFNKIVNQALLSIVTKSGVASQHFQNDTILTSREKEVLLLICEELSNSEIANKIFLSPRTVQGIRSQLMEKTGAKNTAGLVKFAIRNNLMPD
jgi:DNA-binding NarL/FixJ family response regulator